MRLSGYTTIIVFTAGFLLGMYSPATALAGARLTSTLLIALMAASGYYLSFHLKDFYRGLRDPQVLSLASSTILGGALAGAAGSLLTGLPLRESLAVSLASGWYSFAGAYVGVYDPVGGLIAFVGNLAREAFTLALYPLIAERDPLLGVTLGGATTMDTSLGVIARSAGPRTAGVAFAHGLIVTLLVPIILPAVYP